MRTGFCISWPTQSARLGTVKRNASSSTDNGQRSGCRTTNPPAPQTWSPPPNRSVVSAADLGGVLREWKAVQTRGVRVAQQQVELPSPVDVVPVVSELQ